jgi:hypothetical protein
MTMIDHASIAGGMKCIPLPRRKRGGQSAAAEAEFERVRDEWCQEIIRIADTMDYKIGARDWCYMLEVAGSLTKGEFDAAEKLISACRKDGRLPVDICCIDNGRPTANLKYVDRTTAKDRRLSAREGVGKSTMKEKMEKDEAIRPCRCDQARLVTRQYGAGN